MYLISRGQPKCPSTGEWVGSVVFIYWGILFSLEIEDNPALCNNMGKSGRHYAERNKPAEEQILPDVISMRNLKSSDSQKQKEERWLRGWETGPLPFSGPQVPHPSKGVVYKVTCKDVINCVRLCFHNTILFMKTFISVSGNEVKKEKAGALLSATGN